MNTRETQLWEEMVRRSRVPAEWYDRDYPEPSGGPRAVWVYRKVTEGRYEVGYYDPDGHWHPEDGVYACKAECAERVNYLNGGRP